MEYRKITIRVGGEDIGRGIEFDPNAVEGEVEEMVVVKEEAAAITPVKAKTAKYLRKMPKKKNTFGRTLSRNKNKKAL